MQLPTRVIVTAFESFNRDATFLLETKNAKGTYAALSHCWGSTNAVRTTYKNIESHKQKILYGEESQAFLDAIEVCRALSIKYLWIDSLCIIQYDPRDPASSLQDWKQEAQQMGSIYKNAALTIAATGASDESAMGLFGGDRSHLRTHVEIPYRFRETDNPDGVMFASPVPKNFDDEVSDSRLYTRGWVLQERLLSTRYLHFGKDQWFWQCRETGIQQISVSTPFHMPAGADMGMLKRIVTSPDEFSGWWMNIVETYSRLSFTIKTDRSIALRGLVTEIQKLTRKVEAGGIWLESLHHQLLWVPLLDVKHRAQFSDLGPLDRQRSAPSWSWLSSDWPIYFTNSNDLNRPDSIESTKMRAVSRIKFTFKRFEAMGRPTYEPGPSRLFQTDFLVLGAQMKTILVAPENGEWRLQSMAGIMARDRAGPLAIMAAGYNEFKVFDFALLDPTRSLTDDGSKVGSCFAYDGFDTDLPKDKPLSKEHLSSFGCVRISDNMSKDESGVDVVEGYNVMLVRKASDGIEQLGNLNFYRKTGVGIVRTVGWFHDVKPIAFIVA